MADSKTEHVSSDIVKYEQKDMIVRNDKFIFSPKQDLTPFRQKQRISSLIDQTTNRYLSQSEVKRFLGKDGQIVEKFDDLNVQSIIGDILKKFDLNSFINVNQLQVVLRMVDLNHLNFRVDLAKLLFVVCDVNGGTSRSMLWANDKPSFLSVKELWVKVGLPLIPYNAYNSTTNTQVSGKLMAMNGGSILAVFDNFDDVEGLKSLKAKFEIRSAGGMRYALAIENSYARGMAPQVAVLATIIDQSLENVMKNLSLARPRLFVSVARRLPKLSHLSPTDAIPLYLVKAINTYLAMFVTEKLPGNDYPTTELIIPKSIVQRLVNPKSSSMFPRLACLVNDDAVTWEMSTVSCLVSGTMSERADSSNVVELLNATDGNQLLRQRKEESLRRMRESNVQSQSRMDEQQMNVTRNLAAASAPHEDRRSIPPTQSIRTTSDFKFQTAESSNSHESMPTTLTSNLNSNLVQSPSNLNHNGSLTTSLNVENFSFNDSTTSNLSFSGVLPMN